MRLEGKSDALQFRQKSHGSSVKSLLIPPLEKFGFTGSYIPALQTEVSVLFELYCKRIGSLATYKYVAVTFIYKAEIQI